MNVNAVRFGARYIFRPETPERKLWQSELEAVSFVQAAMASESFAQLHGEALAADPESGAVYLQTRSKDFLEHSPKDAAIVNWVLTQLKDLAQSSSRPFLPEAFAGGFTRLNRLLIRQFQTSAELDAKNKGKIEFGYEWEPHISELKLTY